MHFSSSGGLSPSSRDGIDPIAELLSQLSGVRRGGGGGTGQSSSTPSQLQQLQMQLQLERQQVRVRPNTRIAPILFTQCIRLGVETF